MHISMKIEVKFSGEKREQMRGAGCEKGEMGVGINVQCIPLWKVAKLEKKTCCGTPAALVQRELETVSGIGDAPSFPLCSKKCLAVSEEDGHIVRLKEVNGF